MSGFYKMYPADWDFGTSNLSLEEEAAYLRIINAIHKHDGPVPYNDRVLAGLFRTSTRKARALVNALIAAGKVTVEDGLIWNFRARSDVIQRQFASISSAERGAKGGRKRAENAAKCLKNLHPPQATASSRIEENRIEYSDANASGEDADFAKAVFERGVAFLVRHGHREGHARSLIGKWRKDHRDTEIYDAFAAASREGVVDPAAWITARLGAPPKWTSVQFDMSKFERM